MLYIWYSALILWLMFSFSLGKASAITDIDLSLIPVLFFKKFFEMHIWSFHSLLLAFYLILYILIHICAILGVISLYLFSSSWFLSFNYCPLWNSFTEFLISVIILHLEFFTELFKKNSIPRFLKNVPLSYSFYFLVSP